MSISPFCWHPPTLRSQVEDWVVDLERTSGALAALVDMEARFPGSGPAPWRRYPRVPMDRLEGSVRPLIDLLKRLVLHETGVALLKCGSQLTPDQARFVQLALGCEFGMNIT